MFLAQTRQPPNVAIPVGSGVGVYGLNLQMHYDNPSLIEGETDASVLRLYLTPTPREHMVCSSLLPFAVMWPARMYLV